MCCKAGLATFGGYRLFKQFDVWLTPHGLWPQQCINFWSGVLPTKFGSHRAFLSNLTPVDASWPLHDLWPHHCTTLRSGVPPTKFGSHRAFPCNLTPAWPPLTPSWPSTPSMHYTSAGILPTNLVAIGQSCAIWPLADPLLPPAWSLTPAMHYSLIRGSYLQIWWP